MKLQLATALSLASIALAAPAVTCGVGNDPDFGIEDFIFSSHARYSTPSHLATSEASVTFSLLLPTKPKALSCSATTVGTYPNYFDGTETFDCVDGKTTSASFKYNFNTQKLVINAEWTCPALGSRYNASGRGKVTAKRNCKTKTTKNPDWSPQNPGDYQDISATCKDSDSTIEINKISGVA